MYLKRCVNCTYHVDFRLHGAYGSRVQCQYWGDAEDRAIITRGSFGDHVVVCPRDTAPGGKSLFRIFRP